jgi:hypothetical protein
MFNICANHTKSYFIMIKPKSIGVTILTGRPNSESDFYLYSFLLNQTTA